MILRLFLFLTIALVPVTISAQAKVLADKRIAFTTPDTPWILSLSLEGFTIEKQQANDEGGRYFMMVNDTNHLLASLFIEPAKKCKTGKACRDMMLKAGNPAWEKPTGLVQYESGTASVFELLIPSFQGQPVRQQNLFAEFVQDGYWVDLHISKVLYEKTDHILFENIVKSAKFESKSEMKFDAATTAATEWLALWDEGKADAAYEKLAATAQKQMTKPFWTTYWNAVRKPLGKLKTRKAAETEYFLSLPGVADQEGYSIRYDSAFENAASVTETIALMREKDGSWRVSHYISNYEPSKSAEE